MGTLCNLNLVIFKCFYYQSEKIVAGDINSLNLLVAIDNREKSRDCPSSSNNPVVSDN